MGYNPLTGKDVTMPKTPTPKKSEGWDSPSQKKDQESPSVVVKEGTKRVILVDEGEDAGEVRLIYIS